MVGQRRLLSVISIVAGSLACGGVAMAATGGLPSGGVHGTPQVHAADVTDSTGSVSSTSDEDTSTTASTDSTDTSMPDDTSTTAVPGDTSTTVAGDTTTTVSTPPTSEACKPGWGYGDTNHCHSGPPGQANKHHDNGHHANRGS